MFVRFVHRDQRQRVSSSGGFLLSDCEVFESVFQVFDDFVLLALGDRAAYRLSYVVKIDEHLQSFADEKSPNKSSQHDRMQNLKSNLSYH